MPTNIRAHVIRGVMGNDDGDGDFKGDGEGDW